MPDYFTDITAQEALKCTPAEADSLIKALIGDQKPEERSAATMDCALYTRILCSPSNTTAKGRRFTFSEKITRT